MNFDTPLTSMTTSLLVKHVHELATWMKRYDKFTPEVRFLMLVDKLQMVLIAFKFVLAKDYEFQIKRVDSEGLSDQEKINKKDTLVHEEEAGSLALQFIAKEFDALEDFIQSPTKTCVKSIEDKLDQFLNGPDYEPGNKIMKGAENDFFSQIKQ